MPSQRHPCHREREKAHLKPFRSQNFFHLIRVFAHFFSHFFIFWVIFLIFFNRHERSFKYSGPLFCFSSPLISFCLCICSFVRLSLNLSWFCSGGFWWLTGYCWTGSARKRFSRFTTQRPGCTALSS